MVEVHEMLGSEDSTIGGQLYRIFSRLQKVPDAEEAEETPPQLQSEPQPQLVRNSTKPPVKKKPEVNKDLLKQRRLRYGNSVEVKSQCSNLSEVDNGSDVSSVCESVKKIDIDSDSESYVFLDMGFSLVNNKCVEDVKETDKKKYSRKLKESINELIETEEKYVSDLKHVVCDYIPSLNIDSLCSNEEITKEKIFSNIEELYLVHSKQFLPDLKKHRNDLRKLAKTFINYETKFEQYVQYLGNKKESNILIVENNKYFEEQKISFGRALNLSSYMLSPVQRLPRYVLFLEEFTKCYTKMISHMEEGSFNGGNSSMFYRDIDNYREEQNESIVECLEKAKQSVEKILNTANDNEVLKNVVDLPPSLSTDKLLLQDAFTGTDSTAKKSWFIRLFLFKDALVITRIDITTERSEVYRYHDHIDSSMLGITHPEEENIARFQVWCGHRSNKNYTLYGCKRIIDKWVNCIDSLLWEEAKIKKEKIAKLKGTYSFKPIKPRNHELEDTLEKQLRNRPKSVGRSSSVLPVTKAENENIRTTWYI